MAAWEIWLCDPAGTRLALLDRTGGFAVSRVASAIGATVITLPPSYDGLFGLDYILEYWRKPAGGSMKFFNAYFTRKWRYEDASGNELTLLWGYDANYLLSGRIVAYDAGSAQALLTDHADDAMKIIAIDALGADAGAGRILTSVGGGVTIAAELAAAVSMTKGVSWRKVLDVFQDLAAASRAGGTNLYFDMVPSFTSAGLIAWTFQTFTTLRGKDRTQDSDNPLFFGRTWGNLEGGYYEIDHTDEYNYVYGRGQGFGAARYGSGGTACDAPDTGRMGASIWNRREEYCNASAGGEGGSEAATLADAKARLEQGRPAWRAGGTLLDTPQARYGVDFDFGDQVTVELRHKQVDSEISAVSFAVDGSGQERAEFRFEVEGA